MTNWNKLRKIARYNVPSNRRTIDRSRRNNANPKTVKHGRRHGTRS